jgi:hypothetical protein
MQTNTFKHFQFFFVSRNLLYVALALSKCSILLLTRTVFTQNSMVSTIAIGTTAVTAIWGLLGVVASAVVCSAENMIPKPGTEHCVSSVSPVHVSRAD